MLTSVETIPVEVKLDDILKKRGIKPIDLAEAINVDPSQIYNMQNKLKPIPNLRRLVVICNYLKVQITEIIEIKFTDD